MADATDLKSGGENREGSSPSSPTRLCKDRHDLVLDPFSRLGRCKKCPLVFSFFNAESRADVARIAREAERDWYIKELES